jgi:Integral membrane protein (DUF2244)
LSPSTCIEPEVRMAGRMAKNCAMSPRQFILSYSLLAVASLLVAGVCAATGVWVVLPFAAAELVFIAILFVLYARHAIPTTTRSRSLQSGCLLNAPTADTSSGMNSISNGPPSVSKACPILGSRYVTLDDVSLSVRMCRSTNVRSSPRSSAVACEETRPHLWEARRQSPPRHRLAHNQCACIG